MKMPSLPQGHLLIYLHQSKEFRNRLFIGRPSRYHLQRAFRHIPCPSEEKKEATGEKFAGYVGI